MVTPAKLARGGERERRNQGSIAAFFNPLTANENPDVIREVQQASEVELAVFSHLHPVKGRIL